MPCSAACSLRFRLVEFTWTKSGQEEVEMFSILTILAIVGIIIAFVKSRVVVPPDMEFIVERFGKPHPVLRTGTHFIVPFVDSVKIRFSTKEIRLTIPTFTELNLENLPLTFESELRYQILDSLLLRESVRHRGDALRELCQTCVRSVVADYELDTILAEQDRFEEQVARRLQDAARGWGVKINGYDAKTITPPLEVVIALAEWAKRERERRA